MENLLPFLGFCLPSTVRWRDWANNWHMGHRSPLQFLWHTLLIDHSILSHGTWMQFHKYSQQHSMQPHPLVKPRAYYTAWSKSEREKQILSIMHIWNLERWHWWTYLQGSNGDADREQTYGHRDAGRKERVEWVESVAWKHIHCCCC